MKQENKKVDLDGYPIILDTLSASLLGSTLAGNRVIGAGENF